MNFDEYQRKAAATIQFQLNSNDGKFITLMGLAGEVGELATEYKKQQRDGSGYTVFKEKLKEEIGDILWYLSAIAEYENLSLSDVAKYNLKKTDDRWMENKPDFLLSFYDEGFPLGEQIPREFVVTFKEIKGEDDKEFIEVSWDGKKFGNPLRDNAYDSDFYRFHDIFHFSYAVVLGWSPVVRRLMECKRKSDPKIDEVEDGGRAGVIDEAISSLVFEYAKNHSFFEKSKGVDYSLLRTIKELTRYLEVNSRTGKDWEKAILLGFHHWRLLKNNNGGIIHCNLIDRTMKFEAIQ